MTATVIADPTAASTRLFRAILALLYIGAATGLPFHVLDELLGAARPRGAGDFPCAKHDCPCASQTDCERGCCCFPAGVPRGAAGDPVSRHLTLIGALACAGFPAPAAPGAAPRSLSPHLAPVAGAIVPPSGEPHWRCVIVTWPAAAAPEVPEPVPRAPA